MVCPFVSRVLSLQTLRILISLTHNGTLHFESKNKTFRITYLIFVKTIIQYWTHFFKCIKQKSLSQNSTRFPRWHFFCQFEITNLTHKKWILYRKIVMFFLCQPAFFFEIKVNTDCMTPKKSSVIATKQLAITFCQVYTLVFGLEYCISIFTYAGFFYWFSFLSFYFQNESQKQLMAQHNFSSYFFFGFRTEKVPKKTEK